MRLSGRALSKQSEKLSDFKELQSMQSYIN